MAQNRQEAEIDMGSIRLRLPGCSFLWNRLCGGNVGKCGGGWILSRCLQGMARQDLPVSIYGMEKARAREHGSELLSLEI